MSIQLTPHALRQYEKPKPPSWGDIMIVVGLFLVVLYVCALGGPQ